MAKIFFRNLFVSLLTTVLATLVAGFFSMMVMVICQELLKINMSVLAIMILDACLALVASCVWIILAAVRNWEWFFNGEKDVCDNPPHIIVGTLVLLLIPLMFGGTSAILAYTGYDKLVEAVARNDNYNLLILLFPAVTVSQVCQFIAIYFHYANWQICLRCGHMFCIDYCYTGSNSWSETSYKTYNTKENVGSVYAGDRKIMDVTGNVSHGYTETWHYTRKGYKGACKRCRRQKSNSKLYNDSE